MKTTTAQFVEFINGIGENYYYDDTAEWDAWFQWDETAKIWRAKHPDHIFDVDRDFGGYIIWQGLGPNPIPDGRGTEEMFKEWLKAQTHRTLVISVPVVQEAEVRAVLSKLGVTLT